MNLLNFNFKYLKYNKYNISDPRRNQERLKIFQIGNLSFFSQAKNYKNTKMVRRDKRREFFRGMNKKKEIYPKKERDNKITHYDKILTCLSGQENINMIIIV